MRGVTRGGQKEENPGLPCYGCLKFCGWAWSCRVCQGIFGLRLRLTISAVPTPQSCEYVIEIELVMLFLNSSLNV